MNDENNLDNEPQVFAPTDSNNESPVSSGDIATEDSRPQDFTSIEITETGQFTEEPVENLTVDTEVSVETVPVQEETAEVTEAAESAGGAEVAEATQSQGENSVAAAPLVGAAGVKPQKSRRKLFIIAAIALVLIAIGGVVAWYVLSGSNDEPAPPQATAPVARQQATASLLGVAVTVTDGTVEYRSGEIWQPLTSDVTLGQGNSVRTGTDSRAVLTLDDGSAVRLDENTTIILQSLATQDVRITHVAGAVYSRVIASDRAYTVTTDNVAYESLGTAFSVVNKLGASGVQVYQSAVKTGDETVREGKQYYTSNPDKTLEGKITDVNFDKLADDAFIGWNIAEDEKDEKFKSSLGVLTDIKQKAADKKAEQERKAKEEQEQKKKQQQTTRATVTRGTMSLNLSGETFKWSYTGKALYGYKLVYSKTNTSPLFTNSPSIYFGSMQDLQGSLPSVDKIGDGTFYVRVCAYTDGTSEEPCVDHSPVVTLVR